MTKNPLINALAASGYIIAISLIMYGATMNLQKGPSLMAPIVVIFLFTLSAAVMGYIFCYQPFVLYLDNKKKEAVRLFLQTVGVMGVFTFIMIFLLFLGVLR